MNGKREQPSRLDTVCNALLAARTASFSVLPIDGNTKRPIARLLPRDDDDKPVWQPFQKSPVSESTAQQWAQSVNAFAVVCGAVSGGLLVIDFDEPRFYEAWCEAVGELMDGMPLQRTGGGGFQVFLRCDDPGRNDQLAWVPDDTEKTGRRIAIETRAEGGYAVVAPSLHPSGQRYQWINGDLLSIRTVSQAHAQALLDAAWRLDEAPFTRLQIERASKAKMRKRRKPKDCNGVIQQFNAAVPVKTMLERAGYTQYGERFIRPGGQSGSVVVFEDPTRSYHHSTNDPLHDGFAHDAFDIFCEFEHDGDVHEAVKAAARELGIATSPPGTATPDDSPDDEQSLGAHGRQSATYPCTDLGNAERFAARNSSDVRYCHAWGAWLVWSGQRWRVDGEGAAERRAKTTVRAIYREAAEADNSVVRKRLSDHANTSESRHRIAAMLSLAKSEEGIPVTPTQLDTDLMLLNVLNGTVDLRAGTLRHHEREDLITKLAPVEFDTDADAPIWIGFLHRIFNNDQHLIDYVRRVLGYGLTGDVSEPILPVFHGVGANGKSTLLDAVLHVMGDYATLAPPSLLLVRRNEEHPTEIADLCGRRLVIASESEKGQTLRLQLVKRLTGDAVLKGRYMRQNYFSFPRTFKTILVTNNKPRVDEDTEAAWRRLKLVPFDVVIPNDERDTRLLEKLQGEASGILRWLVEGCLAWRRQGLVEPDAVDAATSDYRKESDPLREFLRDSAVLGANAWAPSSDLREIYEAHCRERGVRPLVGSDFTEALRKHGCEPKRQHDRRGWSGIGLLTNRESVTP